jgi:hypothetical protein
MSDLERTSKPIFAPLMRGESATLTLGDQITVALWLVKTAMVYDLHAEQTPPRPRYFEDTELHHSKSTLSFYPTYMFFIGSYNGSQAGIIQEDHSDFTIARQDDLIPLSDPIRVYALTLVIKHLVLQICCAKTQPAVGNFYMRDFRPLCTQITVSLNDVQWPPSYAFGDELIDLFIYRWSDVPPPRPS